MHSYMYGIVQLPGLDQVGLHFTVRPSTNQAELSQYGCLTTMPCCNHEQHFRVLELANLVPAAIQLSEAAPAHICTKCCRCQAISQILMQLHHQRLRIQCYNGSLFPSSMCCIGVMSCRLLQASVSCQLQ